MSIITDENDIKKFQKDFEDKLLKSVNNQKIHIKKIITGGGVTEEVEIFYLKDLNMWFYFGDAGYGTPRSWNPFGIGKPEPNSVIGTSKFPIICEINFAKKIIFTKKGKINYQKNSYAMFFEDDAKEVYVYHTGRFNGMRKEFFFKNYKDKGKITKLDGKDMVIIGKLNSPDFAKKVKDLVCEVKRIRKLAKSQSP